MFPSFKRTKGQLVPLLHCFPNLYRLHTFMDQHDLPLRLVDRYLANHIPATWAPFVSHEDVLRQRDSRDFAYQLLVVRCEEIPMETDGSQVRWLFDDLKRIFATRPYIAIESTSDAAAAYFFFSKKRHPSLNPTSDYIRRTHDVFDVIELGAHRIFESGAHGFSTRTRPLL